MTYSTFKKIVCGNLAKYNQWGAGTFRGKDHDHIAKIEKGKRREDVVKEIIESDGVETDLFRKPHQYAHHLNSSQVVCYEFFRPLLDKDKKSELAKALEIMGISSDAFINTNAEFEKEFDDGEGTNFDFFLSADKLHNLYVEVKYTEQGFGVCKDDEPHKQKFSNTYKKLIDESWCIKDSQKGIIDFLQMRKYYQLFRNTLRVQNDSDFVVFLFPEQNTIAKSQFEHFRDTFLSEKGRRNVKGIYWENLVELMSDDFKKKFFSYDKTVI